MVGMGCALWWHGWENRQTPLPTVISTILSEPEPPPPPPPPRADLMRFHPDRTLELLRPDGSSVSIGYHSAVLDPLWINVEFFGGWNREMEANNDSDALLFTSGPTFARGRGNGELGMRLHGDLMLANGTWRSGNLTAARERAWMGITHDGALEFGYGPLTPELEQQLRLFIGGLHAFTNTTRDAPETYEGVYGEMHLADVRIVYGLRADGKLELVETASRDSATLLEFVQEAKARGFQIAIDDFGTGYSSLAYLKNLPVKTIKIDKSFILSLASDENDQQIVHTVLSLASIFKLKVVAEGVEDETSLDILKGWGCDVAQGYYISRPLKVADLETWLRNSPFGE